MTDASPSISSSRPVAIWLFAGVIMIIIQVLLGGITRLTGSGLSITEWKPILGFIPPTNAVQWNAAFEKYKQIAQFKYLNPHFTLEDFKFIYFWEWLHRVWARLIGVVFIIPFFVFLFRGKFRAEMVRPLVMLFLLGILQGLIGWIMVQSGLEDSELIYVSHFRLVIHFIFALFLLVYTFWFALTLSVPEKKLTVHRSLRPFTGWLLAILFIQLIYGSLMAGLKAATAAPTWPTINGIWWPATVGSFGNRYFSGLSFLVDHPLVVQALHRYLAYALTFLMVGWTWQAFRVNGTRLFKKTRILPLVLVLVQVALGIFSVLNSADNGKFLWIAAAHQFFAMLLLLSLVWMLFIIRPRQMV